MTELVFCKISILNLLEPVFVVILKSLGKKSNILNFDDNKEMFGLHLFESLRVKLDEGKFISIFLLNEFGLFIKQIFSELEMGALLNGRN